MVADGWVCCRRTLLAQLLRYCSGCRCLCRCLCRYWSRGSDTCSEYTADPTHTRRRSGNCHRFLVRKCPGHWRRPLQVFDTRSLRRKQNRRNRPASLLRLVRLHVRTPRTESSLSPNRTALDCAQHTPSVYNTGESPNCTGGFSLTTAQKSKGLVVAPENRLVAATSSS